MCLSVALCVCRHVVVGLLVVPWHMAPCPLPCCHPTLCCTVQLRLQESVVQAVHLLLLQPVLALVSAAAAAVLALVLVPALPLLLPLLQP